MLKQSLTIWSNMKLPAELQTRLIERLQPHRLIQAADATPNNLAHASADPGLEQADAAFGQPDPNQIMRLPRLKWVQLSTAGFSRYDTPEFRDAVTRNGTVVCNASSIYAEPCAQHVLAMMLSLSRRLPQSLENQRGSHDWPYLKLRAEAMLLNGQTALLVGYGAIGRRLAALLAPFEMNLLGFRRNPGQGEDAVRMLHVDELDNWLGRADHVINLLPASPQTRDFFDAARFSRFKRDANYYNIGRGRTNDEAALEAALRAGQFAAAYIDAFAHEPLAPDHPLWTTPNCYITPHTAGGHSNEYDRHVEMLLENVRRFQAGEELIDRIM